MSTQGLWERSSINEMLLIIFACMHHLARISSTIPVLKIVAEDGPGKAQTLVVVLNVIHMLVSASCAADALAPQEIQAYVGVEQLFLITSIHGRWKITILKEKTLFLTGGMDILAKLPTAGSILEIMAENLLDEAFTHLQIFNSFMVH